MIEVFRITSFRTILDQTIYSKKIDLESNRYSKKIDLEFKFNF